MDFKKNHNPSQRLLQGERGHPKVSKLSWIKIFYPRISEVAEVKWPQTQNYENSKWKLVKTRWNPKFDLSDFGRGSVDFFKNYISKISAWSWEKCVHNDLYSTKIIWTVQNGPIEAQDINLHCTEGSGQFIFPHIHEKTIPAHPRVFLGSPGLCWVMTRRSGHVYRTILENGAPKASWFQHVPGDCIGSPNLCFLS